MKEPEKMWILLLVITIHSRLALASQRFEDLPLALDCDNEFKCLTGSITPFTLGKQYIYSYSLQSSIKVEKVLSTLLREDEQTGSKNVTENGSLIISPINSCQFVASLEPDHIGDEEEVSSLKVTLKNGSIQHLCSSKQNPSHQRINALKSILSLLIHKDTDTDSIGSIVAENGSKGACLTKYNRCGENNGTLIKYQSTNYCAANHEENELLQSTAEKVESFRTTISRFSKTSNFTCETSLFQLETLDIPKGLSICSVERPNGIVVTSLQCTESLEPEKFTLFPLFSGQFYSSVTLKLKNEETTAISSSIHKTKWVKTSIFQIATAKQNKQQEDFSVDNFRNALENLIESTKSDIYNQEQIKKVRSLLRTNFEFANVISTLNDLTSSSSISSRATKIILMILASEADQQNVMKVLQTIFSGHSILARLTQNEEENILKTMLTRVSYAQPTKERLQFSQFILGYVSNKSRGFSDEVKLTTLIAYSSNLDEFCTRMELQTGERYCLEMSLIENSPIMEMIGSSDNSLNKILNWEAISNFQHHQYNNSTCLISHKDSRSQDLWSVLNCYRRRPCRGEAKRFYRKLIQDESSKTTEKIAAFLAMRQCFDSEDGEVVKNLFATAGKHEELLAFIKGYKVNRQVNGISDLLLSIPEENAVMIGMNRNASLHTRTASNTLAVFELPYLRTQLRFETNMLYFDTSSLVPEVIILSLSTNLRNDGRSILEVEIFIDDLRNPEMSEPGLNFKLTAIIRKFSRTVCVKEIELSQENLLRIIYTIQTAVRDHFVDNHASTLAKEKLRQFIMDAVDVNIFDLQSLSQGQVDFPTVSGIPFQLSWKIDGLSRLLISKDKCTELFSQSNRDSNSCRLVMNPEVNMDGQVSFSLGPDYLMEKRDVVHGAIDAVFPITVDLIRTDEAIEETVKITLPSITASVVRVKVNFKEVDTNANENSKKYWSFNVGRNGIANNTSLTNEENVPLMEIVVTKEDSNRSALKVKVTDVHYEVNLESSYTTDYNCNLKGNITYSPESGVSRNYVVQVGFQNVENSKKIQGKLINDGKEYSLDAYYIRQIKTRDMSMHHGFLSCGPRIGTGILCWWPFCEFCGSEYFIGANVNTPHLKNVKLFEVEVTQIFPKTKINFLFKSEGIPILRKTVINVSLSHGNDTTIIINGRAKDAIKEKLKIRSAHEPVGSGDALPEAEAREIPYSLSVYYLDAQFISELLGQSSASLTFLSYLPQEYFTYESHLFCGEVLYPGKGKGQHENLSYLSTLIYSQKMESSVPGRFTSETSVRSSQFPVLNIDWNCKTEQLEALGSKTVIIIRPVGLIRGEIKVEIADYARNHENHGGSLMSILSSWDNVYLNHTYKVYLPSFSSFRILKGKLALKRVDSVLQTAGIEILVGIDAALELKYNFLPDQNDAFEILTSVTTDGETYGLFHHIEPATKSQRNLHGGTGADANNENLGHHKYSGTYVLGEQSLRATGTFQPRTGREYLPFSKFNIHANSIGGKELEIRIFGTETVQRERIHEITMGISMGNSTILEIINEINPFDETPIKANVFVKDYGELKITDNSKLANKRNVQVKARWYPRKQLIQGKIAFPTSLAVSPLYLDFSATIADESNNGDGLVQLTSESTMSIWKNYSIATKNIFQLKDLKWELGLEGLHVEEDYTEDDIHKDVNSFSFSTHFIQPNLEKYAFEILSESYSDNSFESHHRQQLKIYRPNVTPLHLYAAVEDVQHSQVTELKESELETYHQSTYVNETFEFIICHKDNFLYIFPMLNLDFNVFGQLEVNREDKELANGQHSTNSTGKLLCQSKGSNIIHLCNLVNASFTTDSKHEEDIAAPWVVNLEVSNNLEHSDEELNMKMVTTYEPVKSVAHNDDDDQEDDNIFFFILKTVYDESVFRYTYNLEYQAQRTLKENSIGDNLHPFGVRGTYIFTRMFESINYFEFTDNHKWNSISCGDFHIWENVLNHTTDANQTSELATFSSQYVSLSEDSGSAASNEGSTKNITWMELQSTFNINGFGTLKSVVQQPRSLLSIDEGDVEVDFLIRTEFSPVKALRVTISHKHNKNENEEDDSINFDTLTKLNVMLNNVELSGVNTLTLSLGKLLALGDSLTGRFGSEESYEYITINTFALSPSNSDNQEDNLIHFDVSSSWTNAEDDDTELKIVNDIIYDSPLSVLPLIRFTFVENSTDIDVERNISVLIYQTAEKSDATKLRFISGLPMNILSENLDELSFTELSLESVSQQIVDDYYNGTWLPTENNEPWHDYNVEVFSRFIRQSNFSNVYSSTRWYGFEQKIFHCQSMVDVCYDKGKISGDYRIDTSNYCNLLFLPILPAIVL